MGAFSQWGFPSLRWLQFVSSFQKTIYYNSQGGWRPVLPFRIWRSNWFPGSERSWICTAAVVSAVASFHHTWLPREVLVGQTVHTPTFFFSDKKDTLLPPRVEGGDDYSPWGQADSSPALFHHCCFCKLVLGFQGLPETHQHSIWLSVKVLRNWGIIQILPHLCSNNPDSPFSYLLQLSLPL